MTEIINSKRNWVIISKNRKIVLYYFEIIVSNTITVDTSILSILPAITPSSDQEARLCPKINAFKTYRKSGNFLTKYRSDIYSNRDYYIISSDPTLLSTIDDKGKKEEVVEPDKRQ